MRDRPFLSVSFLACLGSVLPLCAGCPAPISSVGGMPSAAPPPPVPEAARFTDVAAEAGLQFRHEIPGSRPINILQGMGGGAAFLDYDGDGNSDILLISQRVALFRGDGKGKFSDVTTTVLPALAPGWWMGCAVGDYDNDGFDDLYLSAYRGGRLLHNEKGARFADVTRSAGIPAQPWGSACTFGDVDNDGRLDLFVGNYVDFGPKTVQLCNVKDFKTSCSPTVYKAHRGVLFRNLGGGRFADISRTMKMEASTGKVLGAIFLDTDGQGRQSLMLPNDEVPSDLMYNTGKDFRNIGELSGVGFTENGKPYGGMGVDRGDIDGDGRPDIVIGTFTLENKLVLMNEGSNLFTDRSDSYGVASVGRLFLTFGTKLFDFDNDSDLDLMMVNGYIADNVEQYEPTRTYREPTLLFRNEDGQRFEDISKRSGKALTRPIVGRALAISDYDNDGRQDALVVDGEGSPLLLHNETPNVGNYLSLKLTGKSKTRNAYGARVIADIAGKKRTYWCYADGSYLASNDPRVHIGLGSATSVRITIVWPGGRTESFVTDEINRTLSVTEGQIKGLSQPSSGSSGGGR
ncbi:MAG: CRTAC1 family protein [Capsulimonadales bacterium]|nr:CRTAC1 family protein [Capsulimonadales bacterium]